MNYFLIAKQPLFFFVFSELSQIFLVHFSFHNGKPPVIAAMIFSLKLGADNKFSELGGIAGTDYGNRIYFQTQNQKVSTFVECIFKN